MLHRDVFRRSTIVLALAALTTLAACGSDDEGSTGGADTTVAAPGTDASTTTTTIVASTTGPEQTSDAMPGDSSAPPTPEELLADLSDEQIAAVGGIECATELSMIFSAAQHYIAEVGAEPQSLDDLYEQGYLTEPLMLLEMVGDQLRPVEGSGCTDPGAGAQCTADAGNLTLARLAYIAANPGTEPTQAELVADGLTPEASAVIDLVDGVVVAVPGGPCVDLDLTIDWQQQCVTTKKTLEVASEAYFAQNGTYPASEADLAGEFTRYDSPIMDVVDGQVTVVAGGPCEGIDLGA